MKKSKGFKHFILTRYNNGIYDREDAKEWMKERYQLFRATRESVLSQDGDFEWILSFDERTPDGYVTRCLTDDRMKATCRDIRDYFEGYEFDEPWVITSRIDNDDLYKAGAVKAVQKEFAEQLMVIDMHYEQLDLNSGQRYTSGNKSKGERYRLMNNGPFLSLVESTDYVKTCYCRPHNKLFDGYPFPEGNKAIASVRTKDVCAYMVVHSKNMMNKITGYKV